MVLNRDALYIGGAWVAPAQAASPIVVTNSANGTILAHVPRASQDDVDRAVSAATTALGEWSETTPDQRSAYLLALADELQKREEELAEAISLEVGTPSNISRKVQVGLPLSTLRGFAASVQSLEWETRIGNSTILREAVGVVAAISPWNYPLHQLVAKVGGALAAGCTVVAKPASEAPLSAFVLAEAASAAGLPAGVFNLVTGDGSVVGAYLAGHPGIDLVSFTGSSSVGSTIARAAAANLTRVSLELGGKSASLILPDADLEKAVRSSVGNAFLNSGQTCSAWTRLVVPQHLQAAVIDLAVAATERLTVGDPLESTTRLGPLVSRRQQSVVRDYVRIGESEAARVLGGVDAPPGLSEGFYVTPTIFADVPAGSRIAQEEIFGPVLSIIPYDTEENGIAVANNSTYGLAGGVWAGDAERAEVVARQLRTGQVDINGAPFNPVAPFGGVKRSGYGRELGPIGIEEFTVTKAIQR